MTSFSHNAETLRSEIAAAAARMIAEDGSDYGTAKRKAAKQILGDKRVPENSFLITAKSKKKSESTTKSFLARPNRHACSICAKWQFA